MLSPIKQQSRRALLGRVSVTSVALRAQFALMKDGIDRVMIEVHQKRKRRQSGYTLLELLLALALTVIVVGLIASAIHVNMLSLTRVQASLQRKQAARGILGMMQNDIRAGIQFKADDYSGLQDLFSSIRTATGQIAQDAGADAASVAAELADGTPAGDAVANLAAGASEEFVSALGNQDSEMPVFLGTSDSISIDISRLPRVDEYHPSIASLKDEASTVADVKTISYFVSQSNSVQDSSRSIIRSDFSGGLFRRAVDRSVASFEGISTTSEPDGYSDLVAPEVVGLSFRYFSGNDWQTEWDSEEANGFPLAVEIFLRIDPTRTIGSGVTNDGSGFGSNGENLETYRVVVQIPVAEIIESEESDDS